MRDASGVVLDRDVPVRLRDGVRLMANVYHLLSSSPAPVLLSVTPYSALDWFRVTRSSVLGKRRVVVVQADARGMHKSEGHASLLLDRAAEDYYELIEWAARQRWSSGAVGLIGVSYLAMS